MSDVITTHSVRGKQLRLLQVPNALQQRLGKSVFQSIPKAPGVYFFHDANGRLLYIGQSHDLYSRVGSYRQVCQDRHPKRLQRMVSKITSIKWQLCDSVSAAIDLERRLLLEHRPPFNRAGVWLQEPWRILIEKSEVGHLRLQLTKETTDGSFAMPGAGRYVHASLLRCLVRALHPDWSVSDYPMGVMNQTAPLSVQFGCDETLKWIEVLQDYMKGETDELLRELSSRIPAPNDYWQCELEILSKYFSLLQRRKT